MSAEKQRRICGPVLLMLTIALVRVPAMPNEADRLLHDHAATRGGETAVRVTEPRDHIRQDSSGAAARLKPYLGSYTADFQRFRNTVLTLKEDEGLLTLTLPGTGDLAFDYPDSSGFWYYRLSKLVALSFERDTAGRVQTMILHQTTPVPRAADSDLEVPRDIPAEVAPLPGRYELAAAGARFHVFIQDGALAIDTGEEVILLQPPTDQGIWGFGPGATAAVSFGRDETGAVMNMNLHQSFIIPRGLSAAMAAEAEIESRGLRAGLAKLEELRNDPGYYINEKDLNSLGYRLLESSRTEEAIAIFELNAAAYPESFNVYDSLGEALMLKGDTAGAIQNYRKSLELNPAHEEGRRMLRRLTGEQDG